jgi:hypothetical protein
VCVCALGVCVGCVRIICVLRDVADTL